MVIANQSALKHLSYTDCKENTNANGGLEDKEAQINHFITPAMPLELFMEFFFIPHITFPYNFMCFLDLKPCV